MSNRHLARTLAMQTLFLWDFHGRPNLKISEIVRNMFEYFAPNFDDHGFVVGLIEGVLKNLKKIIEQKNIDYKEKFGDRVLRDLSAFANTEGGTVIIGISENGEIKGINLTNKELERITEKNSRKTGNTSRY